MKKSKSRVLEDRLSELPDSLLLHILELLPAVDVVRTTILSNRWRNLWTTVRSLTFDSSGFDNVDRVISFVNGVARFWRGSKIIRFRVELDVKEAVFGDIDSWVSFAVENEVEMLDLHLKYPDRVGGEEEYSLPQCLYSCSSLKQLLVRGCVLETNGEVRWNRLESLEIDDGSYIEKDALNRILLGSPVLELLVLFVGECYYVNFSICSSSLKELRFQKGAFDYPDLESELRICTPNLEKLGMWGIPCGRILLQNVSSLTLATLEFDSPTFPNEYDSPTWILLGEVLRDIYSAIQHVEKVELSDWCIQVLGDAAGKSLLPPCPNVKTLKLTGCLEEYKQILDLVETFPKLTRLVLVPKEEFRPVREQNPEGFSELKFQNSFLSELRTVKVWCTKVDTSFYPLMELVMRYASQLEKVVFFKWFSLRLFHKEVSSFCIKGTGDASFYPLMELLMKNVSQLGTVVFHKRLSPTMSDKKVSSFCIEGTCAASFYPIMELVMKYSSQLDKVVTCVDKVVIRKWLKPENVL